MPSEGLDRALCVVSPPPHPTPPHPDPGLAGREPEGTGLATQRWKRGSALLRAALREGGNFVLLAR